MHGEVGNKQFQSQLWEETACGNKRKLEEN
jgi:hypothetical protein